MPTVCRQCDVVCRGFSGYNSRQWVAIASLLPPETLGADVAVLWLGANDACTSEQQGVPLLEYQQNITNIMNTLKVRRSYYLIMQ